jgi:hypothetical protein
MKEVIVTNQSEWDALPASFEEYTRIIIKGERGIWICVVARENSSVVARENSSVVARENSSVEAWGNSSVVAWENSSVVARENSSVVAWGNSSVVAWESSSVVARENSSVEAWGNSSVVARENSSVVARGNSSVVAWENVVTRIFSSYAKVALYGFAIAFIAANLKANIQTKSERAHIQVTEDLGWFERNAVEKSEKIIIYKRVSAELKTQEKTENETNWSIGAELTVPKWSPAKSECGPGKFHACSRPYFCDEFRSGKGDRYIAIEVKLEDFYEWTDSPSYPHKIGFRKGTVLYECNRMGKKI